jgi:hypothetical protein
MTIYDVMERVEVKVEIACLKVYLVSYDSSLAVLLQRCRLQRVTRLTHTMQSIAARERTQ